MELTIDIVKNCFDLFMKSDSNRKNIKYSINEKYTNRSKVVYKIDILDRERTTYYQKLAVFFTKKGFPSRWNSTASGSSKGILEINNNKFRILLKNMKKDPTHYESELAEEINSKIAELVNKTPYDYLPVKFKGEVYYIKSAIQIGSQEDKTPKTGADPKADLYFLDNNGKECLWVSHKAGTTAKSFQQWGGVSEKIEPKIAAHKEVKKFGEDLLLLCDSVESKNLPQGTSVMRKIEDPTLKKQAVYGNEYGSGKLSRQNVAYVLQGSILFNPVGTVTKDSYSLPLYEIKPDKTKGSSMHINGEDITGDYEPVLSATYRGENRKSFGINHCRATIYPIGGRKFSEI